MSTPNFYRVWASMEMYRLCYDLGIPLPASRADGEVSGCTTTCMTCGTNGPDLGPLKTPFYCQKCVERRMPKCEKCTAFECTKNHAEFT